MRDNRHIELHRIDGSRLTPAQWDAVMTLAACRARQERARAIQAMLHSLMRFCRRLDGRVARRLGPRPPSGSARSTSLVT